MDRWFKWRLLRHPASWAGSPRLKPNIVDHVLLKTNERQSMTARQNPRYFKSPDLKSIYKIMFHRKIP